MDTRVIEVYRGWNDLEEGKVIDFDLILHRKEREHFKNRGEVLLALRELRADCQEEFLAAKLQASEWYLINLMGEKTSFDLYVTMTLGITPIIIPEQEIRKQKAKVEALLRELGGRSPKQLIQDLKLGKEDARKEADKTKMLLSRAIASLGWENVSLPYNLRFTEEEAYWQAWSSTDSEGEFELTFNFHPCQVWMAGDLEFLILHEVGGHFLQMANIKRAIQKGRINPALGLTTAHDPSSFGAEGAADAISFFLDLPLSRFGYLAREQRLLRNFLNNNAHIWANEGKSKRKIARYILSNHPFITKEKVWLNLRNWVKDPLLRTYQYSYGVADFFHQGWNKVLSAEQKRTYLRYALSRFTTFSQLRRYVQKLIGG